MSADLPVGTAGERGAVLVMVALWMPVLLLMLGFVVDTGNWWVHKRHLQMQADAAALAAAHEFRFPCADAPILQTAAEYSGDLYNAQVGDAQPRVYRRLNSKTFHNQPATNLPATPVTPDDTVEQGPCAAAMIDVKLTEVDSPSFFGRLGNVFRAPFINAHSRVSIMQLQNAAGALPVGVPDVNPKSARAWFIDEDTGAVLAETALTNVGTSNGLGVWDNAAAPVPVTVGSRANIGVVVALGGAASTTCGQPLVACYDAGVATTAQGLPSRGLVYIRGWSAAGDAAQPDAPRARDVRLTSGSCADASFNPGAACTFGVQATVDFGTGATDPTTAVGAKLTARVGGSDYPLAYTPATGTWSVAGIPLPAAAGPVNVTLEWEETTGTQGGNACKTGGGNKCTGSFGVVQRAFNATAARSGPIKAVQVLENGVAGANSLKQCSAGVPSCTHDLVARVGVEGNLKNASDVNDPIVSLRVVGGSQNQSLDCDPAISQLRDELATGCAPTYAKNTGTACPDGAAALWSTAQPWSCVAIQTGTARNHVPAGMNLRILGSDKPTACTAPNRWADFPNLDPADPRIVQVFLTPFGSFSGSGSTTVPVTDFATFYVTGWTGQGQGFANPCQGNGDDPVPGNDAGVIVGHFIKYIQTLNTGGGTVPCDVNAFGTCVAVMSR